MNIEISIPPKLFTAFNSVTYFDEPHKYYEADNELISVTTLIHKYQEEFDEDYWSKYKSNQLEIKQHQIIRAWDFINKKGTMKGSIVHDYVENLFQNKVFKYPKEIILNEFGFDPVLKEYEISRRHADNFYRDTFGKLIPIKTEFVMYDKETHIGGMLDILFYNVKMNEFQIWDYKTNKEFTFEAKNKRLKYDLYLLEDCDLEIYSLQLGLYKYIIEKYIPIKLGKSYVVWFSHNNDNYKIIETKNRDYHVKQIIANRISELAA